MSNNLCVCLGVSPCRLQRTYLFTDTYSQFWMQGWEEKLKKNFIISTATMMYCWDIVPEHPPKPCNPECGSKTSPCTRCTPNKNVLALRSCHPEFGCMIVFFFVLRSFVDGSLIVVAPPCHVRGCFTEAGTESSSLCLWPVLTRF